MTFHKLPVLVPACLALAALVAAGAAAASSPSAVTLDIQATQTVVTFPAAAAATTRRRASTLVALPPDAARADAVLVDGHGRARRLVRRRDAPARPAAWSASSSPAATAVPVTVAVRHDGVLGRGRSRRAWSRATCTPACRACPTRRRPRSRPAAAATSSSPRRRSPAAIQPLADWKREKGWPVVVVTTDVTGPSSTQIKAWLQNAYDTWDQPPEYVLLVGDTAEIPAFIIIANYTRPALRATRRGRLARRRDDRPPARVDGHRGRRSSPARSSPTRATPYRGASGTDDAWFTRSIIVARQRVVVHADAHRALVPEPARAARLRADGDPADRVPAAAAAAQRSHRAVAQSLAGDRRQPGRLPRLGLRQPRLGHAPLPGHRHRRPAQRREDAGGDELRLRDGQLRRHHRLLRRGLPEPGQPGRAVQGRRRLHRQHREPLPHAPERRHGHLLLRGDPCARRSPPSAPG